MDIFNAGQKRICPSPILQVLKKIKSVTFMIGTLQLWKSDSKKRIQEITESLSDKLELFTRSSSFVLLCMVAATQKLKKQIEIINKIKNEHRFGLKYSICCKYGKTLSLRINMMGL